MQHTLERRYTQNISLRAVDSSAGPQLVGYAARHGILSTDLGGWFERIRKGAFTRSIQSDRDCFMLLNHSPDHVLGRRKAKTLTLGEDDRGLQFACVLPNTQDGRDVHALVKRGDLSECSFGFTVDDDGDEWGDEIDPEDGSRIKVRTLKSVTIHDCSVVQAPAYSGTSISAFSPGGVNLSSDPMTMDPGSAFAPRNLFPNGVPAEIRAHVVVLNTAAKERRRRLTSLFL